MGRMTLEEVRAAVKELSLEEKEILYSELSKETESLHSEIEKAWVAESERRLDAFEAGREETYSSEEVFSKYRK